MKLIRPVLFIILSLVLTYSYLYPGSQAWLEGRTDTVMSDGTDVTAVSYIWSHLQRVWDEHPSRFFYGTVWFDGADPERGWPAWVTWIERPLGLLLLQVNALEQVTTGLAIVLILFNIAAMYALGRYLKWNPWVSFALAIAWGFSCYTRARAQVHTGFAGVYHIPLIFLGLLLIVRGKSWRSCLLAAGVFLAAAMAPHYYVITAAFLTPFFLLYIYLQPEVRKQWKRTGLRLISAILPAVLLLAGSLKFSLPPEARTPKSEAFPTTGEAPPGQFHPFLYIFAARPVDYFTGDLGMMRGPADVNPLKAWLNKSVYDSLFEVPNSGNTHERTNGVRWSVWILALMALFAVARKRLKGDSRNGILFFAALALFTFWLSLSPDALGFGPSGWLNTLVSQVRVSSRAGIWVHFSLLMITGLYLASEAARPWLKRFAAIPLALVAVIVIEYPPFYQQMRMAPVAPVYSALTPDKGKCGTGLYFPTVSVQNAQVVYYRFLERLRTTDCFTLNSLADLKQLSVVTEMFPPSGQYLEGLRTDIMTPLKLQRLAQCIPLSFVAFDPGTPENIAREYCAGLGWTFTPDALCVSPRKGAPYEKSPVDCR